ncbi:F-box domain containing protein [Tanacetum coccineum]
MDRIPSNIIFDIFSRVPARCLARSRCVSTAWCNYIDYRYLTIIHDKQIVEEPTPILYHQHLYLNKITLSLCFHVPESKQAGTTDLVFKPTKDPFMDFIRKKPLSRSSIRVLGLGFDAFTNTYKMVCVLLKEYAPPNKPDMVKKNLCTMVHVFGTNSWREIPQVPSYPILGKAIFANGCLHWLVTYSDIKTEDGGRPVIWFDVEKEEFGLIDPPKKNVTMEVWVLNKQKEWVPHCRFEKETVPDGYIDVIGCWNKDGDILIKCIMRGNGRCGWNGIIDFQHVNNRKLNNSLTVGIRDKISSMMLEAQTMAEIPQVPSYPISGKAIFANGYLHWLVTYSDIKTEDGGRPDVVGMYLVNSDGGSTREATSSKVGSSSYSNEGASHKVTSIDKQNDKDVVDTGAMKISNISSPNPFTVLGEVEDENEDIENVYDEYENLNLKHNPGASTPA